MNRQAKVIIAALSVLVAVFIVGLGVSLAMDDDEMAGMGNMNGMPSGDYSMGMMQAMGNMNSDAMLEQMRQVLGEDGYQQMLAHMQQNGASMPGGASMDGMLQWMMDGMMRQMPVCNGGNNP